MKELGFIITRHVRNDSSMYYWKECIQCIRKYYTDPIIVIDDNSPVQSSSIEEDDNLQIVSSEIKSGGEINAYYYLWKYKPFKKAVILHDSMFLQTSLDIDDICTARFLWHFDTYLGGSVEYRETDLNAIFIAKCKHNDELYNLYYNKDKWLGCFGVASVVCLSFIEKLFEYFDFETPLLQVTCRPHREAMERLYALACYILDPSLSDKTSLFGNIITDYPGAYSIKWDHYSRGYRVNCPVNKVWSGR